MFRDAQRPSPPFFKEDKGYILVFVLIVFLVIGVVCSSALSMAYLESKQSYYDADYKQAEQAAEAGLAWIMETTYSILLQQRSAQELPRTALAAAGPFPLDPAKRVFYSLEPSGAVLEAEYNDSCIYKFVVLGKGLRSKCRIYIRCEFSFTRVYQQDKYGNKVFLYRNYTDRGRVLSYELLYF